MKFLELVDMQLANFTGNELVSIFLMAHYEYGDHDQSEINKEEMFF